jgi:hypothetical protein
MHWVTKFGVLERLVGKSVVFGVETQEVRLWMKLDNERNDNSLMYMLEVVYNTMRLSHHSQKGVAPGARDKGHDHLFGDRRPAQVGQRVFSKREFPANILS